MSDTDQSTKAATEAPFSTAPGLVPALPPGVEPVCFIVDDEPGIQNILSNAAGGHGFQVKCFRNAAKALKALETNKPALLFLDVSLEGSDAIDVIRGLGAAGFRGTVQLVSGKDAVTLEEVKRVGERHSLAMLPPLQKPFRLETARTIVREFLARPAPRIEPAAVKTNQTEKSVDRNS